MVVLVVGSFGVDRSTKIHSQSPRAAGRILWRWWELNPHGGRRRLRYYERSPLECSVPQSGTDEILRSYPLGSSRVAERRRYAASPDITPVVGHGRPDADGLSPVRRRRVEVQVLHFLCDRRICEVCPSPSARTDGRRCSLEARHPRERRPR